MEGLPLSRPFSVALNGCDRVPHEDGFWILSDPWQWSMNTVNKIYDPNPGTDLPLSCMKFQNLFLFVGNDSMFWDYFPQT